VHRHLRRGLPGVLPHRAVSVAPARTAAPGHLAAGRPGPGRAAAADHSVYSFVRDTMRTLVSAALLLATASAGAAELSVSVDIPRLNVAEYHRPYVAIWIEPEQGTPTTLAVWYDVKLRDSEGEKWLKDMRQWWRRDGRGLSMPVD